MNSVKRLVLPHICEGFGEGSEPCARGIPGCTVIHENETRWVCLEGMNADELAAYDYGCAGMNAALQRILDGKDDGSGMSNEPWETLRRRVLALVELAKAQGLPP